MKFGLSAITLATALLATTSAQSIYEIAGGNDSFSTLAAAVDAAGLDSVLSGDGTYTIFAPTNDAFAALPEGTVDKLLMPEWVHHLNDVLLYHGLGSVVMSTDLVDGLEAETLNTESITINLDPVVISTVSNTTSNVLVEEGLVDITADNGVIHAVDSVLLPTSATKSIVDIAIGNPNFSTLVAAVVAADLVDALSGDGPLTVFAPTNDAFAALPEGTVESLLLPENKDTLIDILTYHVVGSNIHSSAITGDVNVTALNGDDIVVTTTDGVKVNEANVVDTDILASNGIIHVIDAVILPPTEETTTDTTVVPVDTTTTEAPDTTTTTVAAETEDDTEEAEDDTDGEEDDTDGVEPEDTNDVIDEIVDEEDDISGAMGVSSAAFGALASLLISSLYMSL